MAGTGPEITPEEIRAFMGRHPAADRDTIDMRNRDLAALVTEELQRMGMPDDAPPVAEMTVSRWRTGDRSPSGFHAVALRRVMDRVDAAARKRSGGNGR